MATTAREMNALVDRLDTLVDRLDQERLTDLPRERTDAKGDKTLLDALDLRARDLATALTIHGDAKAAFMAAKAAYKVDPTETDTNYAKAFGLAAKLESILDYRTKRSDKSKTDTKVDETKVTDKDTKEGEDKPAKSKDKPVADDKSKTDAKDDSSKEKTDGKAKDDKSEPDAVLAAIKGLTESCNKNHTDAMDAITALEPRLIKPELAEVINNLTREQLLNVLNRRGVSPQEAAILEALAAFTPDEIIARLNIQDAGLLDRFRFAFGGNGTTPTPTRGGSHR